MPVAPLPDHAPASRRTTSRWATVVVLVAGLALGGGHGAAFADDDGTTGGVPTEADVAAAEQDAADKGRDVAAVQRADEAFMDEWLPLRQKSHRVEHCHHRRCAGRAR